MLADEGTQQGGLKAPGPRLEDHQRRGVPEAHEEGVRVDPRQPRGEGLAHRREAVRMQRVAPVAGLDALEQVRVGGGEQGAQERHLVQHLALRGEVRETVLEHGLGTELRQPRGLARQGPDGGVRRDHQVVVLAARMPPQQLGVAIEAHQPHAVVQGEQPAVLQGPHPPPGLLRRVGGLLLSRQVGEGVAPAVQHRAAVVDQQGLGRVS